MVTPARGSHRAWSSRDIDLHRRVSALICGRALAQAQVPLNASACYRAATVKALSSDTSRLASRDTGNTSCNIDTETPTDRDGHNRNSRNYTRDTPADEYAHNRNGRRRQRSQCCCQPRRSLLLARQTWRWLCRPKFRH
jgi:hypothetical protein